MCLLFQSLVFFLPSAVEEIDLENSLPFRRHLTVLRFSLGNLTRFQINQVMALFQLCLQSIC